MFLAHKPGENCLTGKKENNDEIMVTGAWKNRAENGFQILSGEKRCGLR